MELTAWLIPLLVFATVAALVLTVISMASSDRDQRLRERMQRMNQSVDRVKPQSLLREQYLRELHPVERMLEDLPGISRVEKLCEQCGYHIPAYRVVALALGLALVASAVVAMTGRPVMACVVFVVVLPLPFLKLAKDAADRMQAFEDQLPDALDVMSRALRAGNPFNGTLKVVAEEMDDPIATEFGVTFSDLNYGVDVKPAFLALLERVPNVSLSALVTAVLVQRETGGNMAEIMDRISAILRQRHRFRRRLKTLTAEGRMSAWILILMPFVLALVLSIMSPEYLPMLVEDPLGIKLILVALGVMTFGVFWIRRVIRVRY